VFPDVEMVEDDIAGADVVLAFYRGQIDLRDDVATLVRPADPPVRGVVIAGSTGIVTGPHRSPAAAHRPTGPPPPAP